MSDYIPFEIQSEIMKRLPVKSLIQFRSVSKRWKSFIDSPGFIKNYHVNHTNPHHCLLVEHEIDVFEKACTSIIDNHTFPQQQFPLTFPEPLSSYLIINAFGSVDGLLSFFCRCVETETEMVVIWNPAIRKFVRIAVIPKEGYTCSFVGFGVCPDTSDPKLVKINLDRICSMWVVEVFTLSTRVWRTVYTGAPFKSFCLSMSQVFLNGVIYFLANGYNLVNCNKYNILISFDLKSEKFGEVCLPPRLVHAYEVEVMMVNESLGLVQYYFNEKSCCSVWTTKDAANEPFTKIYTVNVEGKWLLEKVLGFRNNGEVVMEIDDDKHDEDESEIKVYEPLSGKFNDVGIKGETGSLSVKSYTETLLLLDQLESVID